MRTLVIGDIHGRIEALKEVLELSNFNNEEDKLIVIGDVADGGYNTYEVVEELLKIKNLILIMGNHDEWFLNHLSTGWAENIWLHQGGVNTIKSYGGKAKETDYITDKPHIDTRGVNVPITHQDFFNKAKYWHVENDMLFVHGGIDTNKKIEEQERHTLLWDRSIINYAKENKIKNYDKVFIGHTTTQQYGEMKPIKLNNLIMVDCGAGWTGKLVIMDINTEEYWLSKQQKPAI